VEFLINLSKPRKSVLITQVTNDGTTDLGTISLDTNFQSEKICIGDDRFKLFVDPHHGRLKLVDPDGHHHSISYSKPASIKTPDGQFKFLLRDELLPEKPQKVPRFVKHSFVLHAMLFTLGVTLSLFQPKVPEKITFEIETTFIEKEIPPPEPVKPPEPPPEKPKVVEAKPKPTPKIAKSKPAPVKKAVAKLNKLPLPSKVKKVVVVPKAAAPAGSSTPNPAAQAAAAQKASVAKALNFMSAKTGGADAGPTFTKNKKGSIYGSGTDQTLNAKNPSILNKLGAKSLDGNITTKGSRMISAASGVSGGLAKGLNNVQGRVSADSLYNGGTLDDAGGGGLDLSGDGSIPQSLIEKILAKHLDKLRYCYEKALLSDAGIGGNVLLQWTIVSSGEARNIRTLRSAISNTQMQGCINREISKIPFPKPSGGEVIVKFPFNFTSSSI
jgi:hypothetical protein